MAINFPFVALHNQIPSLLLLKNKVWFMSGRDVVFSIPTDSMFVCRYTYTGNRSPYCINIPTCWTDSSLEQERSITLHSLITNQQLATELLFSLSLARELQTEQRLLCLIIYSLSGVDCRRYLVNIRLSLHSKTISENIKDNRGLNVTSLSFADRILNLIYACVKQSVSSWTR